MYFIKITHTHTQTRTVIKLELLAVEHICSFGVCFVVAVWNVSWQMAGAEIISCQIFDNNIHLNVAFD